MTTLVQAPFTTEVFDTTRDAIVGGDVHDAMGRLRRSLRELRSQLRPDDWALVGEQARRHPLHGLLLESPFTRRAYEKPRGYAGDAVLMDLIYGMTPAGDDLSPLGGMLYGYEFDSPCFQSVRTRRAILAREIDSVAAVAARRPRALGGERPSARDRMEPGGTIRQPWRSRRSTRIATASTCIDRDYAALSRVHAAGHDRRPAAPVGPIRRHRSRLRGGALRLPRGRPGARAHDGAVPHARPGRPAADRQLHARPRTTPPSWKRSWTGG